MLCLGRVLQHPESNEAWKNRIAGVKSVRSYRDYGGIDGEPTEFEWNICPGFTTLQLCGKINDLLIDLGQTPETFTGRILFMSMFNDISCDRKGNKDECLEMPRKWNVQGLVCLSLHFAICSLTWLAVPDAQHLGRYEGRFLPRSPVAAR